VELFTLLDEKITTTKNKFARLAINIAFILTWWLFATRVINRHIFQKIVEYFDPQGFVQVSLSFNYWYSLSIPVCLSIATFPIVLFSIYIWFPKKNDKINRLNDSYLWCGDYLWCC